MQALVAKFSARCGNSLGWKTLGGSQQDPAIVLCTRLYYVCIRVVSNYTVETVLQKFGTAHYYYY